MKISTVLYNSKLLHTLGNKEEKLSAFLDTGQRNKGEKKTNKRREEKRNLTLIVHMTMGKVTLFLKIFLETRKNLRHF